MLIIIVYRQQSHIWSDDKNQGYVSTSNRPIQQFGKENLKIIVPKDIKIGLYDITEQTKDPISRKYVSTFEIILPRNTTLTKLSDGNYIVDSNFSNKNHQRFSNISFKFCFKTLNKKSSRRRKSLRKQSRRSSHEESSH